jgi:hypothetical protein
MAGHLLGVLESSVVLQINRDAGCPPAGFSSLWNVHRYGRLMRPKPISAWNGFHNNAVGYDAVILSGTVNRSRRREGGVGA